MSGTSPSKAHDQVTQAHEELEQSHLDSKVAATGRGGVVNHLIDIDVALSLLSWQPSSIKQRWPEYGTDVRALTWLRHDRSLLGRDVANAILATDPRGRSVTDYFVAQPWHRDLIAECVRRVMVGIKEWGPILCRLRDGQQDLIALGQVRLALLPMVDPTQALDPAGIRRLQRECRTHASDFERRSGAGKHLRAQVSIIDREHPTHVDPRPTRFPVGR